MTHRHKCGDDAVCFVGDVECQSTGFWRLTTSRFPDYPLGGLIHVLARFFGAGFGFALGDMGSLPRIGLSLSPIACCTTRRALCDGSGLVFAMPKVYARLPPSLDPD